MRMKMLGGSLLAVALTCALAACGGGEPETPEGPGKGESLKAADCGLKVEGAKVSVVAKDLMNPSGLAFGPKGELTICDSGHGRVLLVRDGKSEDYLTGFDTEYWKPGKDGEPSRFKLGPLSAVWLPDGRLVVSDGGKKDGEDRIMVFEGKGKAADGKASSGIPPTTIEDDGTKDPADNGEGNPTGMALSHDGKSVWVSSQGSDAKTWVATFDPATLSFEVWASADEHGIAINSPMQVLSWDAESILVLYSGAGGVDDGLIVQWSIAEKAPLQQWQVPGLLDPMGMAREPGKDTLMVTDNNWALKEVNRGRLARVTLPAGGGEAEVEILADGLRGPTACAYGPDGALYVAELGKEFDKTFGRVLRFEGL